ncbi:MAG: tetratricopeptide repeat protein [Acidobacteriia bacterium]|nr:tetratricopeptide repeat protein [Terriglobia bacterium]
MRLLQLRVAMAIVPAVFLFALPPAQSETANLERTLISIQQSIEAGNLDGALVSISTELKRRPNEAGLLNLRGVVYARQQKLADARADFERAVHLDPRLTPAWQNLARACQILSSTETSALSCAVDSWRKVLKQRPDDSEARISLGTLELWRGNFTESLNQLKPLQEAESSRASVLALRCADLAGLGRVKEANETALRLARSPDFSDDDAATVFPVLKAEKTAPVAVTLVEALDARNGASISSLGNLAVAYEQLNRPADARRVLERVAVSEPQNPKHLIELARLAYLLHDREGALGYLAHARDLTPNDPQIHFLFGLIAMEMDLPIEAKKSLERALALDPKNPRYNYAMGLVALTDREVSSAIPYFETYAAAEPQDLRGHFALGVACFAAGDYGRAGKEMEGVRANPNTAAGAEYFLGRIARLDDKIDEAAAHFEKSIQLLPTYAESFAELARIRLRQGLIEQARAALDRALSLDANSFQANSTLLALYQRTHDARAEEQAARLRKLDEARSARQQLMLRTIEVRPY